MGRHCCVLGCSTGVSLPSHTFPKDVVMMNKWRKAIYSEKIRDLTDEQLRKCVVCYRHFADSDYEAMYRLRRLKPGVIPSLYLPDNGNNNNEANNSNGNETNNSNGNETNNSNSNETNNDNNNTEAIASTRESKSEGIDTSSIDEVEEIEIIEIKEEIQPKVEVSQSSPVNNDPPESEPSSPKTSPSNLLDLHNLLHGKCFHKFTPKMWKLYKLSCILRKKQEVVIKRQLSFRERIKQAKQCSKSTAVEKLVSSLTPIEQTFLQMQISATKYAPKVCKWNVVLW